MRCLSRRETVREREDPLPTVRKPAREGADRCPVPWSRCRAPTPAASLRRSRGRSWTRRKWVSTFLGPGGQTDVGTERAEGGSRVSGALASGSLAALGPQAAEPSRGLQSSCPSSGAKPTPDRVSYRAPAKGLAPKKRAPTWGGGGTGSTPSPGSGAAGPRSGRPGLGTSCT